MAEMLYNPGIQPRSSAGGQRALLVVRTAGSAGTGKPNKVGPDVSCYAFR